MSEKPTESVPQLTSVLRGGVSVVQMIVFKEIRTHLAASYPDREPGQISMLAGAVTNELFGTPNNEERFLRFRTDNRAVIEQEILSFGATHPKLVAPLTDALRVQTLCDSQEGVDSSRLLTRANELGFLQVDRDVPLPSAFMTMVRALGEAHNLIVPPVQINPEHDRIIH